uniref:Tripartite motif-containing protein 16-like n=1 Tax=Gadus morhua TaxID=8049 RepID=A0A8C5AA70_GADMO
MASAYTSLSEENFSCSICLDVFSSPVSTPCGHNFCRTCINMFWDEQVQCKCPFCNELFHARPHLRVNILLSELTAQIKKSVRVKEQPFVESAEVPCDICTGTELAVKFCLVCLTSYCQTHLEPHHRVTGLKKHQLVEPMDRMCKKHDRPLGLFCKTEQVCVCQSCTETDHTFHPVVPLKEVYEVKMAQLGKIEAEVQQMIQNRIRMIQGIKDTVEFSKKEANRAIADGVQVLTALKRRIAKCQDDFYRAVKEKLIVTEKQAEDLIKELEQEIKDFTNRSSEVKQLSHNKDHLHFLQAFRSLKNPPSSRDWMTVEVRPPSYVGTLRRSMDQLEETLNMEMKKVPDLKPGIKKCLQSTMDEERVEGGPTSKTPLPGEHGCQSKAKRRRQERADSPGPSCVSMKSDSSMGSAAVECQHIIKSNLKKKFWCMFEGIPKAGHSTPLNEFYTEIIITKRGSGEVNKEHENRLIETASRKPVKEETPIKCGDIFKPLPGQDKPIRTIMTTGVAGIGKTVLTHKFILDWAEGKANHDIHFTFLLTSRELNLLKGKEFSLVELLHHLFIETKEAGICRYDRFQVVFILDGLDQCRLLLDFQYTPIWTDVTKSTSVEVLLTNLIRGNLLPSARIWITTHPVAANQIPAEYVDVVTEVRGFTDPQKEEYFRKRFREETLASTIISQVKKSRSLHIMCHIPVFCWITATVLEDIIKTSKIGEETPNTVTQIYCRFLRVQSMQGDRKYRSTAETDTHWSSQSRQIIFFLGKLAFNQLESGNLIFYEKDLAECKEYSDEATVYSGLITQKDNKCVLYQDKEFCLVHLSLQDFLAALYVLRSFNYTGVNLLLEEQPTSGDDKLLLLYQSAVDKALESKNGHLDLFLRFLLGLTLEPNQILLQDLLGQTVASSSHTNKEIVSYIKGKIGGDLSPERSINLFHCLNELNDRSLVEDIQQSLTSGSLFETHVSPAQWSALVFILLSSEEELDVFHLKEYSSSEEGLLRLLPVVKAYKTSLLNDCGLSEECCEALASVLSSNSSSLRELDLSSNDLKDSGVKLLSAGMGSPHCTLETLSLSGCLVTQEGCASLVSALSSNPSHLRELDLSYNHPRDSGAALLSARLEDPHWRLDTLSVEHGGVWRLIPALKKYACELTLDPNTAHRRLSLSEDNRKVTGVREDQSYPYHPERFDRWSQVLCKEGLTGRCYWEVERKGDVSIGVTYRPITRRGRGNDSRLGWNNKSWTLYFHDDLCSARHNGRDTDIRLPYAGSTRVGVYLDRPAGTLSFYRVSPDGGGSSDTLTHLHTFQSTFTQEELLPGFRVSLCASVSLC